MATFYKISLDGGETTDLTLNLGALSELSKRDKPLVDRYFYFYKKLQQGKPNEPIDLNELEMGEILYIAYRAAHCTSDDCMTLQEFLTALTDDREELGTVFSRLFGQQEKKQDFQQRSGKRRGGRK